MRNRNETLKTVNIKGRWSWMIMVTQTKSLSEMNKKRKIMVVMMTTALMMA